VLDRFVSAVDAAGGAVAVHCDGNRQHAYTLLAAYLLRSRCFPSAGEAVAWIHMARGAAAPVAVEPALLEAFAAAGRRARFRAFSMCTDADLAPLTRAADAGRPESAACSPFPRGPGSPRRGSCARIFSVSSPHLLCGDDGGETEAAYMPEGTDGPGDLEGSLHDSCSRSACGDGGAGDGDCSPLAAADAQPAQLTTRGSWTGTAAAILRACSSYLP
jgi:hypothetical protein